MVSLRSLDDRLLGDRFRRGPRPPAEPGREGPGREGPGQEGPGRKQPREERPARTTPRGQGAREAVGVLARVSRLVLLLLAAVVALAVVFTLAPTNAENVLVRNVLDLAEQVAGPFRDVFTADDPDRELVLNYGLATLVYLVAATVVGRLGRKSS